MSIETRNLTVGEVAANYPLSTRVLTRYDIDFCCGGGRSLGEACQKAGVSVEQVMEEVQREGAVHEATESWTERPLGELLDHILEVHHRPLDKELPRLEAMAGKVLDVHGAKDPARLGELARTVSELRNELEPHMMKEEQILFPWIRSGRGASAGPPIQVMMMEHEAAGALLERLRELSSGYQPPEDACATWSALYEGLEALDADLRQHIHLENNILFPRALQGE